MIDYLGGARVAKYPRHMVRIEPLRLCLPYNPNVYETLYSSTSEVKFCDIGDLVMSTFLGVFVREIDDVVETLIQGSTDDFSKCVFLRAKYLKREPMAGPKGRLP